MVVVMSEEGDDQREKEPKKLKAEKENRKPKEKKTAALVGSPALTSNGVKSTKEPVPSFLPSFLGSFRENAVKAKSRKKWLRKNVVGRLTDRPTDRSVDHQKNHCAACAVSMLRVQCCC